MKDVDMESFRNDLKESFDLMNFDVNFETFYEQYEKSS